MTLHEPVGLPIGWPNTMSSGSWACCPRRRWCAEPARYPILMRYICTRPCNCRQRHTCWARRRRTARPRPCWKTPREKRTAPGSCCHGRNPRRLSSPRPGSKQPIPAISPRWPRSWMEADRTSRCCGWTEATDRWRWRSRTRAESPYAPPGNSPTRRVGASGSAQFWPRRPLMPATRRPSLNHWSSRSPSTSPDLIPTPPY